MNVTLCERSSKWLFTKRRCRTAACTTPRPRRQ